MYFRSFKIEFTSPSCDIHDCFIEGTSAFHETLLDKNTRLQINQSDSAVLGQIATKDLLSRLISLTIKIKVESVSIYHALLAVLLAKREESVYQRYLFLRSRLSLWIDLKSYWKYKYQKILTKCKILFSVHIKTLINYSLCLIFNEYHCSNITWY